MNILKINNKLCQYMTQTICYKCFRYNLPIFYVNNTFLIITRKQVKCHGYMNPCSIYSEWSNLFKIIKLVFHVNIYFYFIFC